MTEPIKRRRWLRFSLRTLLVVMTVLCVWLGFKVNAARRQKEAVEAILKAGGEIFFDYQLEPPTGQPDKFNFDFDQNVSPPGPAWLREQLGEEYFREVYAVRFFGPTISASVLPQLVNFPELRSAYLCEVKIAPDGSRS